MDIFSNKKCLDFDAVGQDDCKVGWLVGWLGFMTCQPHWVILCLRRFCFIHSSWVGWLVGWLLRHVNPIGSFYAKDVFVLFILHWLVGWLSFTACQPIWVILCQRRFCFIHSSWVGESVGWLVGWLGFTACQPIWVILCQFYVKFYNANFMSNFIMFVINTYHGIK